MNDNYEGWHETWRVKGYGLKFSSMTPGEGHCFLEAVFDQIKSIPAFKNFCTSPDNLRW